MTRADWQEARLGAIVELNPPPDAQMPRNEEVTFLPMAAVSEETGSLDLSRARPYGDVRRGFRPFREGDVLFAKITPSMENGKSAVVRGLRSGHGLGSTEFHVLRPSNEIDPAFLRFVVATRQFRHKARRNMTGTAGQLRVPARYLAEVAIRLPAIAEQREIASEIDQQLSRLDAAVASLRRAARETLVYRELVITRLLTGHSSSDEAKEPWNADLPLVPSHWRWATLGEVAEIVGGVTKGGARASRPGLVEVPYLRVANVQRGYLDLREMKTIRVSPAELELLQLKVGDILFNEGGDRDKLGRGWIWSGEIEPCVHQNHVFRARLREPGIDPRWVSFYANSVGRQYFLRHGKQTTNLASINRTQLSGLPLPMPPVSEQLALLSELDERLSATDEMHRGVHRNIARAGALREAVLVSGLSGRLPSRSGVAGRR